MKRGIGIAVTALMLLGFGFWLTNQSGGFSASNAHAVQRRPLAQMNRRIAAEPEFKSPLPRYAMRARIAPSFGRYRYLIIFRPSPTHCRLNLSYLTKDRDAGDHNICSSVKVDVARKDNNDEKLIARLAFAIPEEEYRQIFGLLMQHWNERSLENRGGTDGTGIGIEIQTDSGPRSAITNTREMANSPVAHLDGEILRLMLAYGPPDFFPCSLDWTISDEMGDRIDAVQKGSNCLLAPL